MSSRPESGGQSASGWLGTQGALFPGASPPRGTPRLAKFGSMQVNFDESVMFTASFDLQSRTLVGGLPVAIAAIATIEWAVEGVQLRRKIDVVGGASISGVAQAVMIKVEDNSPSGTPAGIPYMVSALAAPYPRPGGSIPPTYTPGPPSPVPPGGTFPPEAVPQSIGVRSVQVTAASLVPGATVQAIARVQYVPYTDGVPDAPVDLAMWPVSGVSPFVVLPPGAQTIVVQNLDAVNPITVGVTFGIDG